MVASFTAIAAASSGLAVGGILGLAGGGGSILAVPLLVYAVGMSSTHMAIGTGAIAVSLSALANLAMHARAGNVRWREAAVFSVAGMLGALGGAHFAKMVDGKKLLFLFGMLMIAAGAMALRPRKPAPATEPQSNLRFSAADIKLSATGLIVGTLSGFFGIGGGFLIVPALLMATAMPLSSAIGTSLVAVAALGATTAGSYAMSGLVDWPVAAIFVAGGIAGGAAGTALGRAMAKQKFLLNYIFSAIVISAGIYVVARGLM